MRFNGLTLNVAKTQAFQIGASQEHILFLGQNSIEKQSCVTYLGVQIDEKLAFTDHIHEIFENFQTFDSYCMLEAYGQQILPPTLL